MSKILEYKGYVGTIEFSEEDNILYGKVMGIRSLISYEGTTVSELVADFRSAVDDYLYTCEAEAVPPEKPYKGSFNVRIAPEMHKKAAIYAMTHNTSLNKFIEECVISKLSVLN